MNTNHLDNCVYKTCHDNYYTLFHWLVRLELFLSCTWLIKTLIEEFLANVLTLDLVTVIWVIKCALLGCTFVPSMKSVGQKAYEIYTQDYPISTLTLKFYLLPRDKVKFKYIIKIISRCFIITSGWKLIGQMVFKLFGIENFKVKVWYARR